MRVTELLDRPEKWTKGEFARDKDGGATLFNSSAATCWCLLAALDYCYEDDMQGWREAIKHLVAALVDLHDTAEIVRWQDRPETTWEQVRVLLERANV